MGAFLSALLDKGRERADKAHEESKKDRDFQLDIYKEQLGKALQAGDYDRANRIGQDIDKLMKIPGAKSPFSQLIGAFQKHHESKQAQPGSPQGADPDAGGGGQPGASPAASPNQAKSLPGLEGGGNAPTASGQAQQPDKQPANQPGNQPGSGPGPGKASGKLVTRAFDKASRGLATGLDKVSSALSPRSPGLPPLDTSAFPTGGGKEKKIGSYTGDDGKMHIIIQRPDNSTYETDSTGKVTQGGSKFPRVLAPISMTEAQAQAATGQSYEGLDGKPIDLSRYNQNWQLVPIYVNGKAVYEPTSQGQAHITVGNEVYAVPKLDVANLGQEGVALGQSRTGTTSLPGYVGVGPDNQIERVPGQREPATPGATGGGPAHPSQLPSLDGKTPTINHPVSGHALPQSSKRTASDPGKPGSSLPKSGRVAKSLAVPTTMWNQQQQIARPVREGATQVFGDPSQPSLKSLKDYASIADDKEASARLAEAFNITFNDWDTEIKAAGGITHLVETAGGYPQLLAQLQASVREDAIGKLGSDTEKDYYDSIMSSYGAIVGLRSLTKASAASFSVTAIERELPLVGLNSFSTRQYYDQLSRLAEQVYNGTRTMVDQVMPPEEKLYYKSQVEALTKLRDKSESPGGKKGLPPLVQQTADPAGIYTQ